MCALISRAVLNLVLSPVPLVSANSTRKDGVALLARPSEGIIALHHGLVVIFIGFALHWRAACCLHGLLHTPHSVQACA